MSGRVDEIVYVGEKVNYLARLHDETMIHVMMSADQVDTEARVGTTVQLVWKAEHTGLLAE
jgi:hypothetical protein